MSAPVEEWAFQIDGSYQNNIQWKMTRIQVHINYDGCKELGIPFVSSSRTCNTPLTILTPNIPDPTELHLPMPNRDPSPPDSLAASRYLIVIFSMGRNFLSTVALCMACIVSGNLMNTSISFINSSLLPQLPFKA